MIELAPRWQALLAGKQLLIFDFDGTIADTTPLHAAAFEQTLAPYGVTVDYAAIAGMKTKDALIKCTAPLGIALREPELDELVACKQSLVRRRIESGLLPLPGVDDFLGWARAKYRLAMVTSGSRATVELSIRVLGYQGWFDPMVTADEATRSKPDPQGFRMALEMAATTEQQTVVFEDSDAGVAAASCAGIEVCDVREWPFFTAFLERPATVRNLPDNQAQSS